jgi:hypothetical protein
MDLNSLTWLLVTCVLFQIYITSALIQSACSFGDALHDTLTNYICLSSTLCTSLLVLGGEVPCNLTQVVFDTHGGTSASGETITTFYESMQLDNESTLSNSIPCASNYPFVMGNQLTKKERDQVMDLLIKY